MFIFIDQSLADSIANKDENANLAIETLGRIARSRRQGKHLVSGSRETLKYLSACDQFQDYVKAIFGTLKSELTQIKHALDTIKMKVQVVSGREIFTRNVIAGQVVVTVSADIFDKLSLDSGTKLLCENLIDTEFYIIGTECYQKWARYLPTIPLYFEGLLGGGNTTARVYRENKRNNNICLCIVDSDKKHPEAPCGDTAKLIEAVDQEISNHLCQLEIIEHRELENLLPIKLMNEAINLCPDREPVVLDYFNNLDNHNCDKRKFLDIKNGLKLGKLHHSENDVLKEYWREFKNSGNFDSATILPGCVNSVGCTSIRECNCYVVRGLGDHILEQAVEASKMRSRAKLVEMFPDYLKTEWEELAQTIFAWGCGSNELRVI